MTFKQNNYINELIRLGQHYVTLDVFKSIKYFKKNKFLLKIIF